jgi:hypothetical protein
MRTMNTVEDPAEVAEIVDAMHLAVLTHEEIMEKIMTIREVPMENRRAALHALWTEFDARLSKGDKR